MQYGFQNFGTIAKVVLRGKFIALNAYIRKENNLKSITYTATLENKSKTKQVGKLNPK